MRLVYTETEVDELSPARRKPGPTRSDPMKRFWSKVNKDGPTIRPELGQCWVWTGRTWGEYSTFWVETKREGGHKWIYQRLVGPIPDGQEVCHHCDNKICVRLEHLYLATHRKNTQDAHDRGLVSYRFVNRAYCGNGHARTAENLEPYEGRTSKGEPRTYVRCIPCRRNSQARYEGKPPPYPSEVEAENGQRVAVTNQSFISQFEVLKAQVASVTEENKQLRSRVVELEATIVRLTQEPYSEDDSNEPI